MATQGQFFQAKTLDTSCLYSFVDSRCVTVLGHAMLVSYPRHDGVIFRKDHFNLKLSSTEELSLSLTQ